MPATVLFVLLFLGIAAAITGIAWLLTVLIPQEEPTVIKPGDRVRALPAWHLTTILPPEAADIDPTVEGIVVSVSKRELLVRVAGTPASDFRCYRTGTVLLERAK